VRSGLPDKCHVKYLGSATLTIAILCVFFLVLVLALTALLGLLLPGLFALLPRLAAVLTLSLLSGMPTLLTLSGLTALLAFLLHIVCHELLLQIKRELMPRLRNLSTSSWLPQRIAGLGEILHRYPNDQRNR
jgi:hypothetical protein